MRVAPLKLPRFRQADERQELHHGTAVFIRRRLTTMCREDFRDLRADPDAGIESRGRILRNIADAAAAQPVEFTPLQRNEIAAPEFHFSGFHPHRRMAKSEQLQGY